MKRSIALVAGSAVCAMLLSACGLTSSPADGLTFTAPSGWQSSPGIMGFMQFWDHRLDAHTEEVLMLFRSPRQIDREQVFETGKLKNTKIDSERRIAICGNQPATIFAGTATSSTDNEPTRPHKLDMIMTNANGTTYFAMYVYPLSHPPDAQAESALRELCVKH